jgi:hypothetical protein
VISYGRKQSKISWKGENGAHLFCLMNDPQLKRTFQMNNTNTNTYGEIATFCETSAVCSIR